MRKLAEEAGDDDRARDLYITERKAERGVFLRQRLEDLKKDSWKYWPLNSARLINESLLLIVWVLYKVLTGDGRSFVRPLAWLFASGLFFYWRYEKIFARLLHEAGPANADKYEHAVRMLALGNAVPFVGALAIDADVKKFLFCPGFGSCLLLPPEGYQWLVLGQNLVSIILVFFIGLALRNYFKIK